MLTSSTRYLTGLAALAVSSFINSACGPSAPTTVTRVYVTNERSGDVSIIDAATQTVIKTLPLGKRPRGVEASADGRFLYVALSGSPIAGPGVDESTLPPPDRSADGIGEIDLATNTLVRTISAGTDPEQVAISRDGKQAYVANEDAALLSVIDLPSGKVTHTVPIGEEPEGVALHPLKNEVYVTSENDGAVFAIDTSSPHVLGRIDVGHRPRSIAFLPDGSRAYVTLENDAALAVVDTVQRSLVTTIKFGDPTVRPMGITRNADGSQLYVSTGRFGHLFFVDPAKNESTGSIQVGERPWGVAITPDGRTIYTANGPSNDVTVVDVVSRKVLTKIPAGDGPWGVAIVSVPKPPGS
jgi:YVTN family beta-propeller protein